MNLLANAVKFTEQGDVSLRISRLQTPGGADFVLQFEVRDTGIGIASDKISRVFAAFEQADNSTTRRYGGTGLGLTISKRLVELMGGRMWAESKLGDGSRFVFTLPCKSAERPRNEMEPQVKLEGLRALIVDDSAVNRRILAEILSLWKIDSSGADSGFAAMEMLKQSATQSRRFDLILVDGHLPVMDGFTLVEQIRTKCKLPDVAIMMITSADRADDVARCRALGLSSYLVKPVLRHELQAALCAAVAKSSEQQPSPRKLKTEPTLETTLRRGSILVVEDNVVNQRVIQSMLERLQQRVTLAGDGEQALEKLDRESFDLVLLDKQMPVLDGFATTAEIRRRESGGSTRSTIVALTAHAMQGDRERCLDAGMDGYLSKPIRRNDLVQVLERYVGASPLAEPFALFEQQV